MADPSPTPRRERLSRWALLGLILLLPAVYVPRVLLGKTAMEPLASAPRWVHLLVISASRLEPIDFEQAPPRLARMLKRGSLLHSLYATSPSAAASAVSLWTGRWPRQNGVLDEQGKLPQGAWTLAESARRAGTATAAFLQEPFVTRQDLPGFSALFEDAARTGAELALGAAQFLGSHPDERSLVWIHLERAGAPELEAVLEALEPALEADNRRFDTFALITGFGTTSAGPDSFDPRVPLLCELPSALFSGSRSQAVLSLLDLTGALCGLMQLEKPVPQRGEGRLESREQSLGAALKGAGGAEPVLIQSADVEEAYLPDGGWMGLARVRRPAGTSDASKIEAAIATPGGGWAPAKGEARRAILQRYLELAASAR